jgi:hypothetical protein
MRYLGIFGQTPSPDGGFDLLSCLTERCIGQAEIPGEFPKYQNSQGTKHIVGYHGFICVYLRSSVVKG